MEAVQTTGPKWASPRLHRTSCARDLRAAAINGRSSARVTIKFRVIMEVNCHIDYSVSIDFTVFVYSVTISSHFYVK